jgi:D-3-phosphoglycerate dehydrogenase / 2-oxoglutarate reductase
VSRILVTPRSLTRARNPALEPLEQAGYELVFSAPGRLPSEAELVALLPGCVGYLAGVEPIGERVLAAAGELRAISRNGAGVDGIDLDAAERRGVAVVRAPGTNARGVAELTLALILDCLRHVPRQNALVKSGSLERLQGREVGGRTLGIVGCGAIGKLVAVFGLALGMRVLACDVAPDESFAPAGDFRFAAFDEVLSAADVVSLHSPPLASGRPLVADAELASMRPGAVLVNTARAGLVDPAAVLAALDATTLAAYATDAIDAESSDLAPLLRHERVIATPHIGGYTEESVARAATAAVENLLAALSARRESATPETKSVR